MAVMTRYNQKERKTGGNSLRFSLTGDLPFVHGRSFLVHGSSLSGNGGYRTRSGTNALTDGKGWWLHSSTVGAPPQFVSAASRSRRSTIDASPRDSNCSDRRLVDHDPCRRWKSRRNWIVDSFQWRQRRWQEVGGRLAVMGDRRVKKTGGGG
ncbi:unnamed protein product [Lactuca virosa]|uniref:Uncharacterized protein n=1 Tax=Lactuca virosa TaxID=75947 RepID=A0AAU9NMG2_9ASTR|nr:unnamed protein product [Lactuca virosa]